MLLASVSACANSQSGRNLEQMLAADPKLKDNPAIAFGTGNNTNQQTQNTNIQLPADFPPEIPRYPNAQLQQVTPSATRWTTPDPINVVQSFYQQQFQANNWDLSQPTAQQGILAAQQNGLRVIVTIPATTNQSSTVQSNAPGNTEFTLQYTRDTTTATTSPSPSELANVPQPGDSDFIGPVLPQQSHQTQTADSTVQQPTAEHFNDINQAPQELRQYIQDLAALGVLPLQSTSKSNSLTTTQLEPSKTVTRREYARWLVTANNQIYADSPAQQIRSASSSSQPAFQDVPPSDPDFSVIQGLAEAGLIPSPLSGSSTTVLFRPDAPLTREQMILWKVPIDTRSSLPNASVDAVQQTWGFQDTAKIEPRALQAVLADFQNSDRSNIRRVFGYTTLFQPKKTVTRAEAAAALWSFGTASEGVSAQDALKSQQPTTSTTTSDPSAGE